MRTVRQFSLGVLAVSLVHLSQAGAQDTTSKVRFVAEPSAISCDPTKELVDASARCGLRYERHRLLRGSAGLELDRARFLKPIVLTQYVHGDSAIVYASRYQRNSRYGDVLMLAGLMSMGTSVKIAKHNCQKAFCSGDSFGSSSRLFLLGGGGLMGAGIKHLLRSADARGRALWWNNSTLPAGPRK
jgi:hypothetical protein